MPPREPALPVPSEHESQAAFFRRVALDPRTRDLLIFAIPNGGQRHKAVAAKLKAEGVKSGVPDIFVAEPRGPFHGLFIEMKKPGNAPRPAQRDWKMQLIARGYRASVRYSQQDAWECLCAYMGITP